MKKEKEEKSTRGPGRPVKREKLPFTDEQVEKIAMLGATDAEIADILGIAESTLNNYKIRYPELMESIKRGKYEADYRLIKRFYQRAYGYEHPEEKIFCSEGEIIRAETIKHYPPDTAAAFIWLKNRRGWKDKTEVEATHTVTTVSMTDLHKSLENIEGERKDDKE